MSVLACSLIAAAGPEVTVSGPQPDVAGHIVATGTYAYKTVVNGRMCVLTYSPVDQSLLLSAGSDPALLSQLAACLSPLLDALLIDHPGVPPFFVLLADRDELGARIAAALDKSPDWDGKSGAPRRGLAATAMRDAVNQHQLAREIAGVFAGHGYDFMLRNVGMLTVEKVPQLGGHRLPTYAALMGFTAKHTGDR